MTLKRAMATEPFGYIVKPFRKRDLFIAIEFALHKSRAEADRRALVQELQDARSHIRTLSGMLPICASCKKIRDDKGYWNQIEEYIAEHTEALFSHGLCTDCLQKAYKELEK